MLFYISKFDYNRYQLKAISINNKRIKLSDLIFTWGYMSRVTFLVF